MYHTTRISVRLFFLATVVGCGEPEPVPVVRDDVILLRGTPIGAEHTELRALPDGTLRLDRVRTWSFAAGGEPRPTRATTTATFSADGALRTWTHQLGDDTPWVFHGTEEGCAGRVFWPEAGWLGERDDAAAPGGSPSGADLVAWNGRRCEAGWRREGSTIVDPSGKEFATLGPHGLPIRRRHGGLTIGGEPPDEIAPADPAKLLELPYAGAWPANARVVRLRLSGASASIVPGATDGALRLEVPLEEELPRKLPPSDDAAVVQHLHPIPVREPGPLAFWSSVDPQRHPSDDRVAAVRNLIQVVRSTLQSDASLGRPDPSADLAGDCNEHTALFVGWARAAGVPARAVAGYLRADAATLRPHTWAEVWFGPSGWVAVDPSWGAPFAAADRVALVTGDPDELAPPVLSELTIVVDEAR